VANAAMDISGGVENLGKGAGKNMGEGVNKVTRSIGGLFKTSTN